MRGVVDTFTILVPKIWAFVCPTSDRQVFYRRRVAGVEANRLFKRVVPSLDL